MGLDDEKISANPYANFGSLVTGADFIGRSSHIRSIHSRTFASFGAACVSIVGQPRVGKSSLARYVLDSFATGTSVRGLIFLPVWITVSGAETEQSLFRELAYHTWVWLDDQGDDAAAVRNRLMPLYEALDRSTTWDDMRMRLHTYLRQLRRSGYQVVAVLDEFDAARTVFVRSAPFEFLRVIGSEPDFQVALIVTSRRPLPEIVVPSSAAVSDLPQIFGLPEKLVSFDKAELIALIARSPYADEGLRKALFTWLAQETAGQPFLSAALLAVLHERWAHDGLPASPRAAKRQFNEVLSACGYFITEYHDNMTETLREDGRLPVLLEMIFSPHQSVRAHDAERMAREGIVRKTASGWSAYSKSFHDYLHALERSRDSNDWQLWERTETALRSALRSALKSAYGKEWVIRLEESQKRIIDECRRRRRHRGMESALGDDLLDYTQPDELLKIMLMHWEQVASTLGHEKDDWRIRLELASKVRVSLAHHRRAELSGQDIQEFRLTCQEILQWLATATARRG
jgi:hypothetical protein